MTTRRRQRKAQVPTARRRPATQRRGGRVTPAAASARRRSRVTARKTASHGTRARRPMAPNDSGFSPDDIRKAIGVLRKRTRTEKLVAYGLPAAGAVLGGAAGAAVGGMLAGPPGAVAGGIVGVALGGVAGWSAARLVRWLAGLVAWKERMLRNMEARLDEFASAQPSAATGILPA